MTFPALLHYLPGVMAANMIFTGNGSTAPRTDSGEMERWRWWVEVHQLCTQQQCRGRVGTRKKYVYFIELGEDGWAVGTMGSDMWHEDIGDTMESHRDPGQWPSLQCCSVAAAQQQRRHSAVHCTATLVILSGGATPEIVNDCILMNF